MPQPRAGTHDSFERFESADDAVRAIIGAAALHRVEVRSALNRGPVAITRAHEQVPRAILFDQQSGLACPPCDARARGVLGHAEQPAFDPRTAGTQRRQFCKSRVQAHPDNAAAAVSSCAR
jgi:hypothetical protein